MKMPSIVTVIGGPLHGSAVDRDLVVDDRADLDDARSHDVHPTPYTLRRLDIDSPLYRVECLAPEEMTDEEVRELIDAKDMRRLLLVRKMN